MKTKSSLISVIISMYIGIVGSIAYASSGEVNYVNTNSYSVVIDVAELNTKPMAIDKPEWLDHRVPDDKNKRCPQYNAKFREYGLPVQVFSYIAWRESGCNPKAINARFDKNGKVIKADPNGRGTTTSSPMLKAKARQAALATTFNVSGEFEEQKGTITIIFSF